MDTHHGSASCTSEHQRVRSSWRGVQIVTATTAGYTHWTLHLLRNLRLLGLDCRLHVCAADAESVAFAAAHNLTVVSELRDPAASALSSTLTSIPASSKSRRVFRSSGWFSAVHFKQQCVWEFMLRSAPGAIVLLIDGDVTIFRNPLPDLLHAELSAATDHSTPAARAGASAVAVKNPSAAATWQAAHETHAVTADVTFLNDQTASSTEGYVNSGFMMIRNTAASRAFAPVYLGELRKRRHTNDQGVLNDVLGIGEDSEPAERHRALNSSGALRWRVLDERRFLNGFYFYEHRTRQPIDASAAVAVHHNWIRGDRNKWHRAVAYEAILESDGETYAHFRRRARRSMRVREAWQYRNKSHPGNEFCGQSGPGC